MMPQTKDQAKCSNLMYFLPKNLLNTQYLKTVIDTNKNIRFVSLVAVDLGGNSTDEKIPVSLFLNNIEQIMERGIQTDGSSVVLPGIASLNNAMVSLVPDREVKWFVDYNYDLIDENTGLPTGTIKIPSFLEHSGKFVDSRSVLKKCQQYISEELIKLFINKPQVLSYYGVDSFDAIKDVQMTIGTELEFWVKTPEIPADEEKLSTSQMLKEQYWKKTVGSVRSALEETLILMEKYGLYPEMGHKEAGGIASRMTSQGKLSYVMEQLEIDWRFDQSLQAADNDIFVRDLIEETFKRYGLEVTFSAKPIEGVAGSGKHTHLGLSLLLHNGKTINLFSSNNEGFLSPIGWGAIMGLLKNYELSNLFITYTNDALNRLKPGFEAPVSIVASIGHSKEKPSRNRTVLAGLIRERNNPLATRFELRSPNPTSNTYLYVATSYLGMLEGIKYIVDQELDETTLEDNFSCQWGDNKLYLEKNRGYRTELNVYDDFTQQERESFFGESLRTVWEVVQVFEKAFMDNPALLLEGELFTSETINSFKRGILSRWQTEIIGRIIPTNIELIRGCKYLNHTEETSDLDSLFWEKIDKKRRHLMKDSSKEKSLFTRLKEAVESENYQEISNLQIEMIEEMLELRALYSLYKKNILNSSDNSKLYS
ncbi:MAG: Glutamine synthetase [candidate division WS2 bacterium]|nr:Glutamine synthetase [Candidatus Psychracetigena formicireducens]